MTILQSAWHHVQFQSARVAKRVQRLQLIPLYEKYKAYTMIDRSSYLTNLGLAREARKVDGCVVECGVWRGGMSAGIAEVLGPSRDYYLFDSFEGLPPAKAELDGSSAIKYQTEKTSPYYHDNCRAEIEYATTAMKMSGATSVKLVKGWFEDTIPSFVLDKPIALLRLDGDWYESTMTCLEHFAPRVAPGGLIVIDDYLVWDGCTRAVHDYLSKHSLPHRIEQTRSVVFIRVRGTS
jgi:O-methyltransferase